MAGALGSRAFRLLCAPIGSPHRSGVGIPRSATTLPDSYRRTLQSNGNRPTSSIIPPDRIGPAVIFRIETPREMACNPPAETASNPGPRVRGARLDSHTVPTPLLRIRTRSSNRGRHLHP
ncbi:hypothetical protein NBRGN_057_02080 [Nocardia brasiliensis NBRC 14402]|nr:hypothetical protein NBRGN_057_02080 [Nocardia brasiliensis NBRC 14402]